MIKINLSLRSAFHLFTPLISIDFLYQLSAEIACWSRSKVFSECTYAHYPPPPAPLRRRSRGAALRVDAKLICNAADVVNKLFKFRL
jgi:hypothetical protein